jgi:restriction system protein
MPKVYVVRAEFGRYTEDFLKGGYAAIGWMHDVDLSDIKSRDELYPLYKAQHPEDTSNVVIGQQVGQIARFLLEIKAGDYVITPSSNTEIIHYGTVAPDSYYYFTGKDGCPYPHRRKIKWNAKPIERNAFSVPFQNTIRSSLTVFKVNHERNFFETVGRKDLISESVLNVEFDYYTTVLNRILELDPKEFEILLTHLLTALGFEGAEHTGKPGDGGVDAIGELDVSNLAKIKLFVQAKRYNLKAKIAAKDVKALRQNIPANGQGAFITTCDFQEAAKEVALEHGFPRIGLINGHQLVDLLAENWDDISKDISSDFREKLNLKLGLIVA